MLYDVWDILRVLVHGGWFTVSASDEVHLWQFVCGWEYDFLRVPAKNFYEFLGCGVVEFWRSGIDRDGQLVDCYRLARRETWPLI